MALKKCPRCDLNYILDDSQYCPVCTREVKGEKARDAILELCSVCNENPVLPGKDMCLFCLKEMEGADAALKDTEPKESPLSLDDASEMEEIAIDVDDKDDIPDEIDRELSLDDVLAEEAEGEDSDEDGETEDM